MVPSFVKQNDELPRQSNTASTHVTTGNDRLGLSYVHDKPSNKTAPRLHIRPPVRSSSLSNNTPTSPFASRSLSLESNTPAKTTTSRSLEANGPERTSTARGLALRTQTTDDETRSLLQWKRRSMLRLDWSNVLVPTNLWGKDTPMFERFDYLIEKTTPSDDECETIADALWNGDTCVIPKSAPTVASFLGSLDPLSHGVLCRFLAKFDFRNMTLDVAFRHLCARLYFKAEAQEIDRILEAFAQCYWSCHGEQCIYGSADVTYAVAYSLMLLNTDLHVARGSSGHTKMSKAAFCSNTMATIREHQKTIDPIVLQKYGGSFDAWTEALEEHLKTLYDSVRQQGFMQPFAGQRQQSLRNKPKALLQRMGSFTHRKTHMSCQADSPNASAQKLSSGDRLVSTPVADGPLIEGRLECRFIRGNKGDHSDYSECWVSLTRGSLLIDRKYGLLRKAQSVVSRSKSLSDNHRRRSRTCTSLEGNNNNGSSPLAKPADQCLPRSASSSSNYSSKTGNRGLKNISLQHAVAIPWSSAAQDNFGFLLCLPDCNAYSFKCETANQAETWIRQCNYCAARTTKLIAFQNAVSNVVHFGWEAHLLEGQTDINTVTLHDWIPPYNNSLASWMDDQEQRSCFEKHLEWLEQDRKTHLALKTRIDKLDIRQPQKRTQIESNWSARLKYLDHEIQKYSAYICAIREQQQLPWPSEDRALSTSPLSITTFDLFKEINQELELIGSGSLL